MADHVTAIERNGQLMRWRCSCGAHRSDWTTSRNNVLWGADRHKELASAAERRPMPGPAVEEHW